MLSLLTIEKFSKATGYTAGAIQAKVKRNDWLEGQEYIRAPDGRILIDVDGFEKWARQNTKTCEQSLRVASKSRSTIRTKKRASVNASNSSPQPLT